MPILLKRHHYEVFSSIFKCQREARRDIRWKELQNALCAVGFVASKPGKGSKRTFLSTGPWARVPLCVHKPKNNVFCGRAQDGLRVLLAARYGWCRSTFSTEA
ncbi:hypothetical protein OH77DRAFT_1432279 [Trametes cingulata]|nr:hypothetical protein OH77DRAFT_1432277 [Trametes cingulata]KAI0349198.1 hypothetical protein OH77DRAFT_1432279 [Trametes cingulata]